MELVVFEIGESLVRDSPEPLRCVVAQDTLSPASLALVLVPPRKSGNRSDMTEKSVGLNIFISNQFIQCNTIFNHANIRIRTEVIIAYLVLLLYNI